MPVRLTITRLGREGDGLASHEGARVAVPFTLPGDVVEAAQIEKGMAHDITLLEKSAARVTPPCPHFGVCGGCRLQHAAPAFYENWKRENVRYVLAQHGLQHPCDDFFVTPPATRRRTRLAAQKKGGTITLGYHARAAQQLVDVDACPLLTPALQACLAPLRALLKDVMASDALSLHLTESEGLVELVFIGPAFSKKAEADIIRWGVAQPAYARMLHRTDDKSDITILLNNAPFTARYGAHRVSLPPAPFLQASAEAEAAMLAFLAPFMAGVKNLADLFCGSGLFALSFHAKNRAITAVDADGAALEALRKTAAPLAHVSVLRRNLFREPLKGAELARHDAVLLDPPRAGAKAQCEALAASRVPQVFYVSCNPDSFARDAALLVKGGYRLHALKLFDQFLWSPDCELIACFRR